MPKLVNDWHRFTLDGLGEHVSDARPRGGLGPCGSAGVSGAPLVTHITPVLPEKAQRWLDFKEFWRLVYQVRGNIEIGLVNEKAKQDARQLFHRAQTELERQT